MNTKSKVIVILCSVLAAAFFVLYIVLGFFKPVVVEDVVFPPSGLSQSIFDSQNMTYVQTAGYSIKHPFTKVPYTVDTVDGAKASIGNGAFYEKEPYYFYFSELSIRDDVVEILKREMTDILSITANEKETTVDILKEEFGYINGCSATFYVLHVAAGDVDSFMCLYRMHINDDIYTSGYDLLVGTMDKNSVATTESLNNLYTLANASVYTMQYSKEIEASLLKQKEEDIKEGKEPEAIPESTPAPTEVPQPTTAPENDLFKTT